MVSFYQHWLNGLSKAEALQTAQTEVRRNPRWASPFFWAGFVLNGDPGKPGPRQALEQPSRPGDDTRPLNAATYVITTGALSVISAGIILFLRRRHRS